MPVHLLTYLLQLKTETLALPAEKNRCYFSRRDLDVKEHVILIAVVQ